MCFFRKKKKPAEPVAQEKKEAPKVEAAPKAEPKPTAPKEAPKEAPKAAKKAPAKPAAKRAVVGKYEISKVGKYFVYRLKANNGEILVTSEIYSSIDTAKNAIENLRKAAKEGKYDIYQDKHGKWQFILRAANGRNMAVSANYGTEEACVSAKASFERFAEESPVVELEEDESASLLTIAYDASLDKQGGKYKVVNEGKAWYFQLLANNGKNLCTSMEYASKKSLLDAIERFRKAVNSGMFVLFKDKKGNYQYKFYNATDGRCIAVGEVYEDRSRAEAAAQSLISFGELAIVVDEEAKPEGK